MADNDDELIQMPPALSRDDVANYLARNPMLSGQFGLSHTACGVALANLSNLISGQLGHRIRFAKELTTRDIASLFREHIGCVVGRAAQEQVVRSDTRFDIAVVADEQTGRDGSVVDLPREPVRSHMAALDPYQAVPRVPVKVARPQPARAEVGTMLWNGTVAVNLGPEALFGRKIPTHRSYPFGEPRAVATVPGHSCVNYTTSLRVEAFR